MASKGQNVGGLASQYTGKPKSSRQDPIDITRTSNVASRPFSNVEEDDDDKSFDEDDDENGLEDDEDDEDEDDDDDDEEEEEEEEEASEEKGGFDEKFLAQLMAMDPMFSTKTMQDSKSTQYGGARSGQTVNFSDINQTNAEQSQSVSQGTSFPNMPAYASAASTPSNEFYDGAINFLTEVLGSSDPSMWNTNDSNQNDKNGWSNKQNLTAASPAPTQAQFKNLQPLISNLIARLKGQPVEESEQGPGVLEEDLVVLLQSLMAQRQAQEERKSMRQSERGPSIARHQNLPKQDRTLQQPTKQQSDAISKTNLAFPTMEEINAFNALQFNGDTSALNGNALPQQSAPGFSIVDFDFGEDDDDPDFVPNNINMSNSFGEPSQSFNQTLANDKVALDQQANAEAWQQMISSLGNVNPLTPATAAQGLQMSPGGTARRTRSTSKNVDSTSLNTTTLNSLDTMQKPALSHEDESIDDASSFSREGDESKSKARKRKTYSAEEALERRREANRECARRQRARKKEETETIRREIERIQSIGAGGSQVASDTILDVTKALVGRRRRGRPLGSKNRKTLEEEKQLSEELADETGMADLRADNRMLRAEMYRLREENAKLRATMIRTEEILFSMGQHDLIRNQKRAFQVTDDEEDGDGSSSEALSIGERDLPKDIENLEDPAAGFLAYQPFRVPSRILARSKQSSSSSKRLSAQSSSNQNPRTSSLGKRGRNDDHSSQPNPNHRSGSGKRNNASSHGQRHQQSHPKPSSNNALQDLLRAAADEMEGYDYT